MSLRKKELKDFVLRKLYGQISWYDSVNGYKSHIPLLTLNIPEFNLLYKSYTTDRVLSFSNIFLIHNLFFQ
jgi:hypothetical protein